MKLEVAVTSVGVTDLAIVDVSNGEVRCRSRGQ